MLSLGRQRDIYQFAVLHVDYDVLFIGKGKRVVKGG